MIRGIALTLVALLAVLAALPACGSSGDDGADDAADDTGDDAPGTDCEPGDQIAAVQTSPEPSASGPWGSQAEANVWARPRIELDAPTDAAAGCTYYGPAPALCEPACTGGELCDIHGECVPYNELVDAGTIAITGTTPAIAMEPTAEYFDYRSDGNFPGLFGAGDAIAAEIEGAGDVAGFRIETLGVPVLELPTTELTATEHVGLTMSWTPTDVAGAELVLHMDNDHHAGTESVECIVPASAGALTVPPEILDQLILAGEHGIGTYIENAWVQLRRRGTVQTARGCATFDAYSADFVTVETIRDP